LLFLPESPADAVAPGEADFAVGKARTGGDGLKAWNALFCLDHNPFSAIGRPKLSGIPRFGKGAVQGELSLDKVKGGAERPEPFADLEVVRLGAGRNEFNKRCAVTEFTHKPVMMAEVLQALQPQPGGKYADGTLGGAGHAAAVLAASSPNGWLWACDRDGVALEAATQNGWRSLRGGLNCGAGTMRS
jgi:hypothetical protein